MDMWFAQVQSSWNGIQLSIKNILRKIMSRKFFIYSGNNKFLTINELRNIAKNNIDDFELDK